VGVFFHPPTSLSFIITPPPPLDCGIIIIIVVVDSALSVMLIVVFDVCHRSSAAISGVIGVMVLILPFRTLRMQAGDFIVIGQ
jgi:hypothetical protein